jgi:hypothetical protein
MSSAMISNEDNVSLTRSFVEAFATAGLCCFPDVLSVVQNMEADAHTRLRQFLRWTGMVLVSEWDIQLT